MSDLLQSVEDFLSRNDMKPTVFGREAVNDPNFVSDLRKDREPRRAMRAKVREFMASYKTSGSDDDTPE